MICKFALQSVWSPLAESNCRPTPYHGVALPTELSGLEIFRLDGIFKFNDNAEGISDCLLSSKTSCSATNLVPGIGFEPM